MTTWVAYCVRSWQDLSKIDITLKKCTYKVVDIGFVARKAIADCPGLLDGQKMAFRSPHEMLGISDEDDI